MSCNIALENFGLRILIKVSEQNRTEQNINVILQTCEDINYIDYDMVDTNIQYTVI